MNRVIIKNTIGDTPPPYSQYLEQNPRYSHKFRFPLTTVQKVVFGVFFRFYDLFPEFMADWLKKIKGYTL